MSSPDLFTVFKALGGLVIFVFFLVVLMRHLRAANAKFKELGEQGNNLPGEEQVKQARDFREQYLEQHLAKDAYWHVASNGFSLFSGVFVTVAAAALVIKGLRLWPLYLLLAAATLVLPFVAMNFLTSLKLYLRQRREQGKRSKNSA